MPEELPLAVLAYIQAMQDHDYQTIIRTLDERAIFLDSQNEYKGHHQILEWLKSSSARNSVRYEVLSFKGDKEDALIICKLTHRGGSSHQLLNLHFKIKQDHITFLHSTML